jgi:hypothetical protein
MKKRRRTPATLIRLHADTKLMLNRYGLKQDSYDDVIRKLMKNTRLKPIGDIKYGIR